jgi:predicted flap endonuclease-1-like 5' DNA nuclease
MDSFLANITGAGDVVTWEISGELPEGLTFGWSPARDAAFDGSIRGTPTELMEMTNFTIWANNSAYSQSFEVSLTVIEESISEEVISEEVIPEEVIPEDDDDSERGWMWCFPFLIILLLLLLIPLLFGSDKILLMLADGPEPENTTSSPSFLSGSGTVNDPFVLKPITGLQPGESASSVEVITIDKMSDIQVDMIDLNQKSNGDKFCMYEAEFGDTGTRIIGIGKDGEIVINMKFDDGLNTPTFEGGEYNGMLKLGRASVYLSWSVKVKKNLSKKAKYEKAAKKAEKTAAKTAAKTEDDGESETKVTEGTVAVAKEKVHSTLDRDGDGDLTLEDVKTGAVQAGKTIKKGASKVVDVTKKGAEVVIDTVVSAKNKTHEYLDKDGDGKLTKEDLKIATGRTDEKIAVAKAAKAAKKKAKAAKAADKRAVQEAKEQAAADEIKKIETQAAKEQAKIQEEVDTKALEESKAKVAAEENKIEQEKADLEKAARAAEEMSAEISRTKAEKAAKAKAAKEAKKKQELKRVEERSKTIDFSILGVAKASDKDDLQVIKGIGPFIEEKLNALGIYTFLQVSKMTPKLETDVNKAIEFFPGRVKRDEWANQAKKLHSDNK